VHTPSHIRKNSGFSTQEEHMVLLGLEALTETPNLRYATRSMYYKNYLVVLENSNGYLTPLSAEVVPLLRSLLGSLHA
jgi:hypothetical protein